jgi:phosphomannomutase
MLESLLGPFAAYAGSVFVTASHLPPEWNGLKLFSRQLGRGLNKVDQRRPSPSP